MASTPDLTTLGKIIGGGLPVGAYGGRADIMDHVLPAGKVFQAGTLSGNPLATAAGIATLEAARRRTGPYRRIEAAQRTAGAGFGSRRPGTPACRQPIGRVGSMMTLFFNAEPVVDWNYGQPVAIRGRYARYFWGLIDRGVYMPCSQYEALFVSAAHSDADVDVTVAAARAALAEIAQDR